jgi:hypothetical protein
MYDTMVRFSLTGGPDFRIRRWVRISSRSQEDVFISACKVCKLGGRRIYWVPLIPLPFGPGPLFELFPPRISRRSRTFACARATSATNSRMRKDSNRHLPSLDKSMSASFPRLPFPPKKIPSDPSRKQRPLSRTQQGSVSTGSTSAGVILGGEDGDHEAGFQAGYIRPRRPHMVNHLHSQFQF